MLLNTTDPLTPGGSMEGRMLQEGGRMKGRFWEPGRNGTFQSAVSTMF